MGAVVDCGRLKCGLSDLGAVPFARLLHNRPGCPVVTRTEREMSRRMAIRSH